MENDEFKLYMIFYTMVHNVTAVTQMLTLLYFDTDFF